MKNRNKAANNGENRSKYSDASERAAQKQLRVQKTAANAALASAVLLLAAIFVFSSLSIGRLEGELYPLIDEGLFAAHSGDFQRVKAVGEMIESILRRFKPAMMIYASHRDIFDMLRCSGEIVSLGADGEKDDYVEAFAGLGVMLGLLRENNSVSLGNLL